MTTDPPERVSGDRTKPESNEKKLGKYELLGPLGHGGMAEVYLARQHGPMGFEKLVAIKRLLPHFQSERQFVQMFLDEARIAARIDHPNVVQIFELGKNADGYFLAMEFLAGESLARVMGEGLKRGQPLPPWLAASVVSRVCEGLHNAHYTSDGSGQPLKIVHRDISPQNVMLLYDGRVKVLDFGIAKARQRVAETTVHGLKGKYAYMSPEQCLGKPVDLRSDIFSCGILLWETLAQRRLFKHKSRLMILKMITEGNVVPPHVINSDVSTELSDVALKALGRAPEQRYSTAEQMSIAIDEVLSTSVERTGTAAVTHYMETVFGQDRKGQQEWIQSALTEQGLNKISTAEQWLDLVPEPDQRSVFFSPGTAQTASVERKRGFGWLLPLLLLIGLGGLLAALYLPITPSYATRLRIVSHPKGASIKVDGRLYAKVTPAGIEGLESGSHQIELSLPGYQSWQEELNLARGETLLVRAMMRADSEAGVASSLASAESEARGSLPETDDGAGEPSSDQPRESERSNVSAPSQPSGSSPSRRRPARRIHRATGLLNLVTDPWATIYYGKKRLGETPLVRITLPVGRIRLRAVNRGARIDRIITVRIRPEEVVRRSINLRP